MNPREAPKGYNAVASDPDDQCSHCAFQLTACPITDCRSSHRRDGCTVVFKKTRNEDPVKKVARRLSCMAKTIVDLGPQGSARYIMLDMLRKQLNQALAGKRVKTFEEMSKCRNK